MKEKTTSQIEEILNNNEKNETKKILSFDNFFYFQYNNPYQGEKNINENLKYIFDEILKNTFKYSSYISVIIVIVSILIYFILCSFITPIKIVLKDDKFAHTYRDKRKYALIKLENGIEALLISNPNTTICSFAYYSNKGVEYNNGVDGLSHLSLNILFRTLTGYNTKFDNLFSRHYGKKFNSYGDNHSSIYFEIEKNGFEKSIIYFSNCIKESKSIEVPNSIINNEIARINYEYQANLLNRDEIEKNVIFNVLYNGKIKYFALGNNESLIFNKDLIKNITKANQQIFAKKNIRLAVYANLDLNELRRLIIKNFQDDKINKDDKNVKFINTEELHNKHIDQNEDIESQINVGNLIIINMEQTNANFISISFYFNKKEIQDCDLYLKFFKYLADDKEYLSLYNILTENNLIFGMKVNIATYTENIVEFKLFFNSLIKENNDSQFLNEEQEKNLFNTVGDFFLNLKKPENQLKIKYLYDEFKRISEINFKFEEMESNLGLFAFKSAKNLQKFSKKNSGNIPMGDNYFPEYNSSIINKIISKFNFNNSNIVIGTYQQEIFWYINYLIENNSLSNFTKEKNYKTFFAVGKLNKTLFNKFYLGNNSTHLKTSNDFITGVQGCINKENKTQINKDNFEPNLIKHDVHKYLYHKVKCYKTLYNEF